ncbi:MAG: MMPL family transporter [Candidatus Woesearchaeota archaeon]
MSKLKAIFTSWRVILLIVFVILSLYAINPKLSFEGPTGVAITNVIPNSSANNAGISPPPQGVQPRDREIIHSMQGQVIRDLDDYYSVLEQVMMLAPGDQVRLTTNVRTYTLILQEQFNVTTLNETEIIIQNSTIQEFNETTGAFENRTIVQEIERNLTTQESLGVQDIGLQVKPAPFTNIRKGLDLEGGTRVMLQPQEEVDPDDFSILIENMMQRLNVYGLSDIRVVETVDLVGDRFILVEVPGASQEEVTQLVSQQGRFEAKISGDVAFRGGDDIRSVLRGADRAGIDPQQGCGQLADGTWSCRFFFGIILSNEAAQRQADITRNIPTVTVDEFGAALPRDRQYLSEQLDFYLDDVLVESLNIGADLKGRAVTDIQISGSGEGRTESEARINALAEMRNLQTILITGSLPVTLEIVKVDSISPALGAEFLNNAILVGLIAIFAVAVFVFIIYRRLAIVIPMLVIVACEMILLLGFAAAFRWSIDMAAIAGIIIVIGTGVDHLIIITDETLRKTIESVSILQRLKRAFGIILVAGLTTFGAMLPLLFAGAGLLRGFALITMVGIAIGVLIARPAYSAIINILLRQEE